MQFIFTTTALFFKFTRATYNYVPDHILDGNQTCPLINFSLMRKANHLHFLVDLALRNKYVLLFQRLKRWHMQAV